MTRSNLVPLSNVKPRLCSLVVNSPKLCVPQNILTATDPNFPPCAILPNSKRNEHRRDQLLKEIAAGVSQVDRNTQDQILELLSESFGVICFAGDGLHALMWAHYTDSHRGLAIQFSENDPLFSGPASMRMEYSDERVTYDASDLLNRAGVESFVRRKSSDWGYEKESRLVLRLQEMVSANTPEGLRYFLPISPTLIVSVTLGLRASDDLQHEVKTLLAAPAFQHVSVFRVRKDDNKPEFCLQRL